MYSFDNKQCKEVYKRSENAWRSYWSMKEKNGELTYLDFKTQARKGQTRILTAVYGAQHPMCERWTAFQSSNCRCGNEDRQAQAVHFIRYIRFTGAKSPLAWIRLGCQWTKSVEAELETFFEMEGERGRASLFKKNSTSKHTEYTHSKLSDSDPDPERDREIQTSLKRTTIKVNNDVQEIFYNQSHIIKTHKRVQVF